MGIKKIAKSVGDSGTFGPAMKNVPNSLAPKPAPKKLVAKVPLTQPKMSLASRMNKFIGR